MKKVALVFVLAVLVPSLVLAWLAVRSLRDEQFLLERQQSLLDQNVTDTLAQNISGYLAQRLQEFDAQVETMAAAGDVQSLAARFDDQLRQRWPLADVGFCVTTAGKILSPLPNARPAAQLFRLDNSSFLGNREPVEVYLTANNVTAGTGVNGHGGNGISDSAWNFGRGPGNQSPSAPSSSSLNSAAQAQSQQSSIAEPSGAPNSFTPPQQNLALASAGESAGGGGGGRNADVNASSNSTRNQASQLSFSIYNSRAIPAGNLSQKQQQEPKLEGIADARYSSRSSQAFIIGGTDVGGGFGGSDGTRTNDFSQNKPAPSAATVALTDSSPPASQEKQKPPAATESNKPVPATDAQAQSTLVFEDAVVSKDAPPQSQSKSTFNYKSAQSRNVSPQSQAYKNVDASKSEITDDLQNNLSKVIPAEAEFRQLIGDQTDGMFARFLQNKLKLMCWHRLGARPDLIFGAQLNLDRVVDGLRSLVQSDRSWGDEICLAVLDDNARPVVLSREKFQANWKRPFVATEVGDALPHWEVAAYLVNPAELTHTAQTARLTLGLLVVMLVVAIGIGSLLIARSLNIELKLARQKTDFVSNVSHELKTPLTSIRMFSELLAEGRVADHAKQHSYLQIITAEAGRLTRLINNVLDFSRMESGEKKYNFQSSDLTGIVRGTAETFRPHLESAGFKFVCELPETLIRVRGDSDALAQIIVNLLSNAEKYSNGGKEITLQLMQKQSPLSHAEIKVLDRGPGVPRGSEEKIFEKFYRAHDSLNSGVQGSGLGLTIARQIARAHGGDVVYEPREGGGSSFILRLPVQSTEEKR